MKTLEEPINYAEVLKNAAQSALAGYESSIAHGGIRDEQQEIWIVSLFSGMQAIAQVAELKKRLAQVERERDAAVRAISDAQHYIKNLGAVQYGLQQLEKWDYYIKQCGVCEENSKEGKPCSDF